MNSLNRSTPMARHRFHLLDALRGLAAIFVVMWHLPDYFNMRHRIPGSFLAVDFFFCLSGFVIAFSYERRLREGLKLRDFAMIRVIRLYPLYCLGTVLGLLLSFAWINGYPVWVLKTQLLEVLALSLLWIPNLTPMVNPFLFPFDPPAWSLTPEILANIVLAWAVTRKLAQTWALCAVYVISFAYFWNWIRPGNWFDTGWRLTWSQFGMGFVRMSVSFLAGVLLLRLFRRLDLAKIKGWVLPVVVCGGLAFFIRLPFSAIRNEHFDLLAAGIFLPIIVFIAAHSLPSRALVPSCIFLGEISYPLYLLHFPLWQLLFLPWTQQRLTGRPHAQALLLTLLIPMALGVSYAAATWFDKPLRSYLSKTYFTHGLQDAVQPVLDPVAGLP